MVSKFFLTALVVVFASIISGCKSEPAAAERVPMPTGNIDLRQQLLSELNRRGIWYNELNESQIEIELESMGVVGDLFDGMIREVLPDDRSISPAPQALPALIEALDSEDVDCELVQVFEKDWLVCSRDDMPLVDETLTKVITETWEADSN